MSRRIFLTIIIGDASPRISANFSLYFPPENSLVLSPQFSLLSEGWERVVQNRQRE
jgi:hypothetical protein